MGKTMTDRELLEAAARAVNGGAWHPLTHDTPNGVWNPLLDDGDAFRLAVRLNIDLLHCSGSRAVSAATLRYVVREDDGADPCTATRRAIVRAAAAIGGAE